MAASRPFREQLAETLAKPELHELLVQAERSEAATPPSWSRCASEFRERPDRQALQKEFAALIPPAMRPRDEEERGQLVLLRRQRRIDGPRARKAARIGRNFAWRSFFHGGPRDMAETWRPDAGRAPRGTTLSDVFRSQATSRWIVAISHAGLRRLAASRSSWAWWR